MYSKFPFIFLLFQSISPFPHTLVLVYFHDSINPVIIGNYSTSSSTAIQSNGGIIAVVNAWAGNVALALIALAGIAMVIKHYKKKHTGPMETGIGCYGRNSCARGTPPPGDCEHCAPPASPDYTAPYHLASGCPPSAPINTTPETIYFQPLYPLSEELKT